MPVPTLPGTQWPAPRVFFAFLQAGSMTTASFVISFFAIMGLVALVFQGYQKISNENNELESSQSNSLPRSKCTNR